MKTHLSTTPLPADSLDYSVAGSTRSSRRGRYFFVGMSVLFFLIAVIGFTPSYQGVYTEELKFHWFAHVHGAIMTSWLVLFLTQSLLAARNNLKYHRQLGQFGFVLGILVYLVMGIASVRGRLSLYIPLEDGVWDVLLIELSAMNLFGLFFIWGMLVRKNAAAHKRLLFLATMVLLQAAVDRTRFLPGMNIGVNFIYLDLLLIPLFIYDWRILKRIHGTTLAGTAILIATQLTVTMVWGAPQWHQFWYNQFEPYTEKPVEIKLTDVQSDPLLGNYGDKKWHLTVSRDDDKLYLKLPDIPILKLGAMADTALFVKTMTWNLSFTKGANGQVTQLTNTQGSLVWKVPKMKQP